MRKVSIVICGAGIAGVSAAYYLSHKHGIRDVLLIDPNPPLSLTSDHSTECYRNWWPGPDDAMVKFMNHSIDLIEGMAEKSNNLFHMNRRGYLFLTAMEEKIPLMMKTAQATSQLGAGPLRIHDGTNNYDRYTPSTSNGYTKTPPGADLILDSKIIHHHFPYLNPEIAAALHVRRAGWLSAQQMGIYMLEQSRLHGVRFLQAKVTGANIENNRIVSVSLDNGEDIETRIFINAAGPFLRDVGKLVKVDIPVYHELHLKLAIKDPLQVIDRSAPLLIWDDVQTLNWSQEEHNWLAEDAEYSWLLKELPSGVHTKPEGGPGSQIVLVLWEYSPKKVSPKFPITIDPQYPEIALRGLAKMLPGISEYIKKIPRPRIDGGYYTKTQENRPIIGKLPVEGTYAIGAFSGFGIMASCAAGDLLASYISGNELPPYAAAFSIKRYENPEYLSLLEQWEESGQL